jgi:hypothetical protein
MNYQELNTLVEAHIHEEHYWKLRWVCACICIFLTECSMMDILVAENLSIAVSWKKTVGISGLLGTKIITA